MKRLGLALALLIGLLAGPAHAWVVAPNTNCPIASANQIGCVKAGTNITIDANGAISATTSGGGGGGAVTLGSITTANPSISGDVTSGFYTAGAALVNLGISGVKVVQWASTGETITGALTVSANSSLSGTTTISTAQIAAGNATLTTLTAATVTGATVNGSNASLTGTTTLASLQALAGNALLTTITATNIEGIGNANLAGTTTVNNITITGTCIGCGSAANTSLSSLTSATATNSIDNTNKVQTWAWGTLSTETALTLTSSSVTSGIVFQATAGGSSNTGYAGFFTNTATLTGFALGAAGSINITNGNYRIGNVNAVRIPDNTADVTSIGVGQAALAAYITTTGNNVAIGLSALTSSTTGVQNTCGGSGACAKILTDSGNTAWGYQALANMAIGNTTTIGGETAVGFKALALLTSSQMNTAVGYSALATTITGAGGNTAVGWNAIGTATGIITNNTAIGWNADQQGGQSNIAVGQAALAGTVGSTEIAIGINALNSFSLSGNNNIAIGNAAGQGITNGGFNLLIGNNINVALGNTTSAVGFGASVKVGTFDVAVGASALAATITNNNNTVGIGYRAFTAVTTGANNTCVGFQCGLLVTVGGSNTILGAGVGSTVLTTGSSNILIGTSSATGVVSAGDSSKLNIGGMIFNDLAGTSAPTISSCGTSPSVDAHANNYSGTVTVGSVSATTCTVTFAHAYTTWNHCRVTAQTTLAGLAYSYTTAAITVSATGLTGDLIDYQCDGY